MSAVHRYIGFAIPAGFALLFLWAIYALIRNRAPNDLFWNLLATLQVIIGIQVVIGAILFASNLRSQGGILHYAYGGLFPALVLIVAHRLARRFEDVPWLVFGIAGFICFGLTGRALMTGLGIG